MNRHAGPRRKGLAPAVKVSLDSVEQLRHLAAIQRVTDGGHAQPRLSHLNDSGDPPNLVGVEEAPVPEPLAAVEQETNPVMIQWSNSRAEQPVRRQTSEDVISSRRRYNVVAHDVLSG
jgi:hypothetical protein